ncbi:MAG: class I SAM-dependent methyltransferase [Patescibacteria group bacterium]
MPFQRPAPRCPVCEEKGNFLFLQDFHGKEGDFSLYECSLCHTQWWMPFESKGARWYESAHQYAAHTAMRPKIYRHYHKLFLKRQGNSLKNKIILDVGCGTGEFLAELEKRGAIAWGIDFDSSAIGIARKHFGLRHLYAMSIEDFGAHIPHPRFDVVTCFEVLQYSDHPMIFLEMVRNVLGPEGVIFLSVPSRERIVANWYAWDFPPNHLTRWNREALHLVFEKLGLRIAFLAFIEQFGMLVEAANSRLRFGLTRKAQTFSKNASATVALTRGIVVLSKIKEYLIGIPSAIVLWIGSFFGDHKNGTIFVEIRRERSTDH